MGKDLIVYVPVINRALLDFLRSEKIRNVYCIPKKYLGSEAAPIGALSGEDTKVFLEVFGNNVKEFSTRSSIKDLKNIIMVNDDVSRAFAKKFLKNKKIEWKNIFLRWDASRVHSETPVDVGISKKAKDIRIMTEAYKIAQNSSDSWRQVGAIGMTSKGRKICGYNKGEPYDQTPVIDGQVRDYVERGASPEKVNFIHAEQLVISSAAREGVSMSGGVIYVTHFPCPICAKLIAESGIKKVYFSEGSSVVDAKTILDAFKIKIFAVDVSANMK